MRVLLSSADVRRMLPLNVIKMLISFVIYAVMRPFPLIRNSGISDMSDLQNLLDERAVVNIVNALFVAVDERDWNAVRACLADRVHFDVTSLGAASAQEMAAEEIIVAWQQGLANLDAVHHQSGNFRVTLSGGTAECFCYATAYHFRRVRSGNNIRTFAGSYDFRLRRDADRWRITQFKFKAKFVDGNANLEKEESQSN